MINRHETRTPIPVHLFSIQHSCDGLGHGTGVHRTWTGVGLRPERGCGLKGSLSMVRFTWGTGGPSFEGFQGPFQIKLVVAGGRKAEQGQRVQTEEQVALGPPWGPHTGSGKSWGWGLGTRLQRGRASTEERCCLGKRTSQSIFWACARAARDRPVAQLLKSPPNEAVRPRGSDLTWSQSQHPQGLCGEAGHADTGPRSEGKQPFESGLSGCPLAPGERWRARG